MMTGTPESVTFVPISRIEILNSRDRNMKVFEEIVDNIRSIGLKKPITVTERPGEDGPFFRQAIHVWGDRVFAAVGAGVRSHVFADHQDDVGAQVRGHGPDAPKGG